MSNSHGITTDNLLHTLPEVLRNDPTMLALATPIAKVLSARLSEIGRVSIYAQIDMLPEELLDILAVDFKVDWYSSNYSLSAKRALIKDSYRVHRHLGTRGAVDKALSDIYPGSQVEEWFEYGGKPYFFRVILDVTDQRVDISQDEIIRAVNIYKSLRSHLEDEAIRFRSRIQIVIGVSCGYVIYGTRLCGTYPVIATQGASEIADIDIDTNGDGVAYRVRYCGAVPGSIM